MGVKEFLLGYKRYCVTGVTGKHGCVDKCFPTKAEAKRYKKEKCACDIQKQVQRKPYTCETSQCGKTVEKESD